MPQTSSPKISKRKVPIKVHQPKKMTAIEALETDETRELSRGKQYIDFRILYIYLNYQLC